MPFFFKLLLTFLYFSMSNDATAQGEYCSISLKGKSVGILRPITFMNNSGVAARKVSRGKSGEDWGEGGGGE